MHTIILRMYALANEMSVQHLCSLPASDGTAFPGNKYGFVTHVLGKISNHIKIPVKDKLFKD